MIPSASTKFQSTNKVIDMDKTGSQHDWQPPQVKFKKLPIGICRHGSQGGTQKISVIPFTARGARPEAMRGQDQSTSRSRIGLQTSRQPSLNDSKFMRRRGSHYDKESFKRQAFCDQTNMNHQRSVNPTLSEMMVKSTAAPAPPHHQQFMGQQIIAPPTQSIVQIHQSSRT